MMTSIVRILFVFLILCTNKPTYSDIDSVSVGLGLIDENILTYQVNENGDRNLFEFRALVETQAYYDIFDNDQLYFIPSFAFQFPESTEESAITKYRFILGSNLGYRLNISSGVFFMLRGGAGLYFTYLSSDGGTSTLPNGNSTTDFPLPPESTWANNLTANLGAEFGIQNLSFKAEGYIFNPTNSLRRSFTYTLTAHLHFTGPF